MSPESQRIAALKAEVERLTKLARGKASDALVCYGDDMLSRVVRQAKIEVLNKILDDAMASWEPDPTIPDRISQDLERPALIEVCLLATLQQLEKDQ